MAAAAATQSDINRNFAPQQAHRLWFLAVDFDKKTWKDAAFRQRSSRRILRLYTMKMDSSPMADVYARRQARDWRSRLYRALKPPDPFIRNPREPLHFPLGRWNLYVGGGGSRPQGYINIDLFALPGVNVVANAERLPFESAVFQCIECDAVLEHVQHPDRVMQELTRVLAPGGHLHLVTPICHPFHQYPSDYRRFTIDGLKQLVDGQLEVVAEGWRTGPTATALVFTLEYVKLWFPLRSWRIVVHGVLGWLLFPVRYLDLLFFHSDRVRIMGNHCYIWLRKR